MGKGDKMKNFTLSDEQTKEMTAFIGKHIRKIKCGEHKLEIAFTTVGDLAVIKCSCGASKYLGEV